MPHNWSWGGVSQQGKPGGLRQGQGPDEVGARLCAMGEVKSQGEPGKSNDGGQKKETVPHQRLVGRTGEKKPSILLVRGNGGRGQKVVKSSNRHG